MSESLRVTACEPINLSRMASCRDPFLRWQRQQRPAPGSGTIWQERAARWRRPLEGEHRAELRRETALNLELLAASNFHQCDEALICVKDVIRWLVPTCFGLS